MRLLICAAFFVSSAWAGEPESDRVYTFGTTVVQPAGLRGAVYHIPENSWELPDFASLRSVGTIYTPELNIPVQDFKAGFPGLTKRYEWFAIDYTGRFWVGKPGMYRFKLTSDDGSRLYIDDQLICDNDGQHPVVTRHASLRLKGGVHRVRLSYFQGPRMQVALILEIAPPGEPFRIFNTDRLKPPPNPETWEFPEDPDADGALPTNR